MIKVPEQRTVRAVMWRCRWILGALFVAVLFRVALPGLVGAFSGGDAVVVLTRPVAAGAVLADRDVRIVKAPSQAVPDQALKTTAAAVGERLSIGLPKGAVLDRSYLGPATANRLPAGRVAAAVRLSDPGIAGMVSAGDRVDIMASAGSTGSGAIAPAEVLAESALVLEAVGAGEAAANSGFSSGNSGLLMVA
ncbi:MAG: flagella basal body P-ring formation protein FlgA, partial [Bifidobacteriaceae bacterium]|nr:flagella basal body P-ring formation protein FlgA [Bifidobacteriaceae bacterium]